MAMASYFSRAWPLCGALDLGYAAVLSWLQGGTVARMLNGVASGPLGDGVRQWGVAGPLAGVAVHFALMAAMMLAYGWIAGRSAAVRARPWLSGLIYGLLLYGVMYWIVLPLRWPALYPVTAPGGIARSLFPHIALVGIPMALIARRFLPKGTVA